MGVPEGGEREEDAEKIFKGLMAENFPNWRKNINLYIQETQQIPSRRNTKRSTLGHIVKMLKDKEKNLKAAGKTNNQKNNSSGTKEPSVWLTTDF